MHTLMIDFDSPALMDLKSFAFMKKHVIEAKPHLVGVRITSTGSTLDSIPTETFRSLNSIHAMIKLWLEHFLSKSQRSWNHEPMEQIDRLIKKLAMYAGQSTTIRSIPIHAVVEEIAIRIFALSCDMRVVPICERVRLTSTYKYDHTATDLAFFNGIEEKPYVIFGFLENAGSLWSTDNAPTDEKIQSMIIQHYMGADLLECWGNVRQELATSAEVGRPPKPHIFFTGSEAHQNILRLRNAQRA